MGGASGAMNPGATRRPGLVPSRSARPMAGGGAATTPRGAERAPSSVASASPTVGATAARSRAATSRRGPGRRGAAERTEVGPCSWPPCTLSPHTLWLPPSPPPSGGERCEHPGCDKSAQPGSLKRCKAHGGEAPPPLFSPLLRPRRLLPQCHHSHKPLPPHSFQAASAARSPGA